MGALGSGVNRRPRHPAQQRKGRLGAHGEHHELPAAERRQGPSERTAEPERHHVLALLLARRHLELAEAEPAVGAARALELVAQHVLPCRHQVSSREQPLERARVPVVELRHAHEVVDARALGTALQALEARSGRHHARLEDAQVEPDAAALEDRTARGQPQHVRPFPAREARLRDLQDRGAAREDVPDPHVALEEALDRQVLAERTEGIRRAPPAPRLVVLARVRADRVVLVSELARGHARVALEPARSDRHRRMDRSLVDQSSYGATVEGARGLRRASEADPPNERGLPRRAVVERRGDRSSTRPDRHGALPPGPARSGVELPRRGRRAALVRARRRRAAAAQRLHGREARRAPARVARAHPTLARARPGVEASPGPCSPITLRSVANRSEAIVL